ncbi:MAG TPA: molybdopterin-dependent oxidoreductase, partial [Acidimicrobiales bacterium]
FSRTSAVADVFVPIRAGSDIAFLGAVVNHILTHGREFRDYVVAYTNASAILSEDFRDTEDLDGLFSGWDPESRAYDNATWQTTGEADPTLEHPRCVFQVLKRHFARYTPDVVEDVCGVPRDQFLEVAEALCANSGRERTSAICYAVGWTQHTVGVQYIRTAAIIQLLLGNIGRPGGGILALRGHASIQGSTDIPTLYDLLPGYLAMPHAALHTDLAAYLAARRRPAGAWARVDAYLVSLLKAWWGDHATAANDYCFDHLPRIDGDHSAYRTMLGMLDGTVKGYFLYGQNPAVGSSNSRLHRLALAQLDWLVVRDLVEIESATFWLDGPEIETGELVAADVGTEVFFLPAAAHTEKDGTFTNTQRLLQWHHQAVEPPGDCRSDLWFAYHLGRIIREKLAASDDPRDRPLLELTWDYPVAGPRAEPSAEAVLQEINGFGGDGAPLSGSTELAADGSTSCGCWIYCGCFAGGVNQTARRRPGSEQDWVAAEWAWAWPANRRLLYNRASADPAGKPWSERKRYLWWDEAAGRWAGPDVPDFPPTKRPDAPADLDGDGLSGTDAFIVQGDGRGWLFAPTGVVDGPLPTHYEPHESPVANPLYGQQANPARKQVRRRGNRANPTAGQPGADVFPYVVTTYRLTEHHTAGGMSRFLAYLAELQPAPICEVGPELAAERGLEHGDWATVVTARSAIEARVLVTDRLPALMLGGRRIHQVGLPYHWGTKGLVTGDSANDLLGLALDPNVVIQESKAGTCDVRPGRRPRGPALPRLVADYRQRAGLEADE